jgi:predicted nucleotidyltransferase
VDVKLQPADLSLLRDFLAMVEGTKCFLVGAGARVLTMENRWDLRGARSTKDWDFAIRVESSEQWMEIATRLVSGAPPRFSAGFAPHRFLHADGGELDLVPYGGLESPKGQIAWPDKSRMSVCGFEESEGLREFVDAGNGLVIPVAAVPSLALLKLHPYADRRSRGERRDIQDFDWLLRNYESADNEQRVHDDLGDALREELFDTEDAGAALLGLDVSKAHARDSIDPVRALLDEARDSFSRLVGDVIGPGGDTDDENRARRRSETSKRFLAFEAGLEL